MGDSKPLNIDQSELFTKISDLAPELWSDLAALDPREVCRRALVSFEDSQGYRTPFLGTEHLIDPVGQTITVPPGSHRPGFQAGLVLLNYLTHASEEGLSGRMVTARELNGGALFFTGPHALSTGAVEERYGQYAAGLVAAGEAWGGLGLQAGDGAFRLLALPKILVAYTLYEGDEEFSPSLTVTFDAATDRHLPLDSIWALVNVMTARLAAWPG